MVKIVIPLYINDTIDDINYTLQSIEYSCDVIITIDGDLDVAHNLLIESLKKENRYNINYLFIYNKKLGLAYALNKALENCCDEDIIFRLDFGDAMYPNRIPDTIEYFEKYDCDVVSGGADVIMAKDIVGFRSNKITKFINLNDLYISNPLLHPMTAFKYEAFISAGGYRNLSGCEDYDLWFRMLKLNKKILIVNKIFGALSVDVNYYKRRINSSVISSVSRLRIDIAKEISIVHLLLMSLIIGPLINTLKRSALLLSIYHYVRIK